MTRLAQVFCTLVALVLLIESSALGQGSEKALKARISDVVIQLDQSIAKKDEKGKADHMPTYFAVTDKSTPWGNFYFTRASEGDQQAFHTRLNTSKIQPNFQFIRKSLESALWAELKKREYEKGEGGFAVSITLKIIPGPWRNALEFPLGTAVDGVLIKPSVRLKQTGQEAALEIAVKAYLAEFKSATLEKALQAIAKWIVEEMQAKDK